MGVYKHSKNIWIKTVTLDQLIRVEIGDWLEGYGDILSFAQLKFIRKYGFLLFKLQDDPQWDGTDVAHPAFWRGSEYGCHQAARLVKDVLSGKNTGKGAMSEPAATMRNSVLELKRLADYYSKRVHELEEENGVLFEKLRLAEERLGIND